MKNTFLFMAAAVVIFLTACSKDDNNGIRLQAHDANRMMDTMHAMMDRMMAMPKPTTPK